MAGTSGKHSHWVVQYHFCFMASLSFIGIMASEYGGLCPKAECGRFVLQCLHQFLMMPRARVFFTGLALEILRCINRCLSNVRQSRSTLAQQFRHNALLGSLFELQICIWICRALAIILIWLLDIEKRQIGTYFARQPRRSNGEWSIHINLLGQLWPVESASVPFLSRDGKTSWALVPQ